MSIGSLLFSPSGRIAPSDFMKGAIILIVVGLVLGLLGALSIGLLVGLAAIVSIVSIYCWIVLWVKRLHDAGKSGWIVLLVILVWGILAIILNQVISGMFAGDAAARAQELQQSGSTDLGAVFAASMAASREIAVPSAIANAALSFIVVYVGNMLLKSDPGTNRFGPPPAG